MELSRRENSNRKVHARQEASRNARAPQLVSELLTLREACERFDLDFRQVYAWARDGLLHPVKPAARTLYPDWELQSLVKTSGGNGGSPTITPRYHSGAEFGQRAA